MCIYAIINYLLITSFILHWRDNYDTFFIITIIIIIGNFRINDVYIYTLLYHNPLAGSW